MLSSEQNWHSAVCALQTKLLTDTQYSYEYLFIIYLIENQLMHFF